MNRREFSKQSLSALGLGMAGAPMLSSAQGGDPVEGTNYIKLGAAAPTAAPAGKIEVVEFFWYGCPHCYHFEPSLNAWIAKLPADVAFRRVPVVFRENPFGIHQRIYYTLEAMGLLALHGKVFHARHEENLPLDKPDLIADFMVKQGVDRAKFMAVLDSFAVQTKCRQARTLAEAYKIDGVPTVGIGGQFTTSISLNGTPEKALATVDFLVNRLRKAK
jgi:thiol:disulfide interchange protein DsbA